ncbi:MAG: hypothetical protein AAFN38_09525 [Cyanobacteria bacterium J06560_5]
MNKHTYYETHWMSLIPPPRLPQRFLAIALSLGLPLLVAIPAARGQVLTPAAPPEAAPPKAAADDMAVDNRAANARAERISPLTEPLTEPAAIEPVAIEPATEPAAEDIPEEILRTEIITEARSPLTGEPVSAAEYAQLQDELAGPAGGTLTNQNLRRLFFLLEIRRAIKPILPFIR